MNFGSPTAIQVVIVVVVDVICGCAITLSLRSLTLALPSWRSTSMYLLAISWLISSSVSALSLWLFLGFSLGFLAHSLQTQSWDLPNVTLHFNVDVLFLGAWVLGVSTSWCVIEFNKVRLIFCSILFFQVRHPGWYHCSDVWLVFVYRIADYILNSSLSPHPEIILSVLPPAIFPSVLFTSDSYHYIQFALYAFRLVVQIFDLPSPTCVATIWLPVHGHPTLYKVNPLDKTMKCVQGLKETSRTWRIRD